MRARGFAVTARVAFPILWCLQLLEQGLGEGMVGELIALSSFDRLLEASIKVIENSFCVGMISA